MPYVIRTRDKRDSAALRAETRAAHLAWLEQYTPRILAAGGFLDDEGNPDGGGMIVLDTEDRAEAERLVAEDPYFKAGLFEDIEVRRWRKVFFGGEKVD